VSADHDQFKSVRSRTGAVRPIQAFSTCPESRDVAYAEYADLVRTAARASEASGCFGILIYAENRLVDPWLVTQIIVEATDHLVPLIAVQPAYSHPYTVAKLVSTITNMHGREVYLNLVAGGFRNDLFALGDPTEHDDRYRRLEEFAQIVAGLCRGEAVTMDGRFYTVKGLRLTPPVPSAAQPAFMVSGSSAAGLALAASLPAIAVRYPLPPGEENEMLSVGRTGIRIGIVARADREEAWRVARETFPPERKGEIAHGFAMNASDSQWHQRLASAKAGGAQERSPYWLEPFSNYQTFCPYLVGSYAEVAAEIRRYVDGGTDTVILDIPPRDEELQHGLRSLILASG
jgi:alkanesulfonate monooxygenase